MAEEHQEPVAAFMKGVIKVGRWAKELINERWQKVTGDKLPAASAMRLG